MIGFKRLFVWMYFYIKKNPFVFLPSFPCNNMIIYNGQFTDTNDNINNFLKNDKNYTNDFYNKTKIKQKITENDREIILNIAMNIQNL
jgi:hypothetical protein